MKCTNCGQEFAVGKFCPSCGTPAPQATAQNSLAADHEEQPVVQTYAYPQAEPTVAPQTAAPERTYQPPVAPVMPVKRKATGAIVAVILGLLLIAGIVAAIFAFGGKGPADTISEALKKNVKSEIFNFEVTVDAEGETMNFAGTIEINPEEYVLNMYMDASYTGDDEKVTMCIYDGQYFGYTSEDGEKWYTYTEVDEDVMEEFFDYYLEYSETNLNKKKDVLALLEEMDDLSDGELSEIVDLEILAECITEYADAQNDPNWLEENAGFSKEKEDGTTYYIYEPDLYDLAEVSLPFFEEAFEDDDYYDEAEDVLKEARGDLKAVRLDVTFGVKSGYLTSVLVNLAGVEIEATFSDFGKAELDYDELEDLASECEKGYEEQWGDYYN